MLTTPRLNPMTELVKCPCCLGTGRRQDPARVGARLRRERERAGISLARMAALLGIHKGHLSYLETGKRNWQPDQVEKYRSILHP